MAKRRKKSVPKRRARGKSSSRAEDGHRRNSRVKPKKESKSTRNRTKISRSNKTRKNKTERGNRDTRKPRKSYGVIYKDSKGRFTTNKKWERQNLPPKKRTKKRAKEVEENFISPAIRKKFKSKKWIENERFTTEGRGYEYRAFECDDYAPKTFLSIIRKIKREKKPWPVAWHVVIDYTSDGDVPGSYSTIFRDFDEEECELTSNEVFELAGEYEVETIDRIVAYFTYSLR